jgi:glycosyltransferase involved in cell wall biosynthesis
VRICLVNYRYFVSSGPERYLFGVKRLLEERGHETVPFSVRYRQNEPSPWDRYFVPPIAGEDEIMFRQHSWSASSVRRALARAFYSREVYDAFSRELRDARPDVAYVLHYMRKLSPSVLTALRDQGVPIVVRLSDFQMVCPQAHMVRDDKVCELCVGKRPWPSVRYRCVQGSLGASLVNALAMEYAQQRRFFDLIDAFVAPSDIMRRKMVEGGVPAAKIHEIPTFVKTRPERSCTLRERRICYIGRIEPIKGIDVLLDAIELLRRGGVGHDVEVVIAGDMSTPTGETIRARLRARPIPGVSLPGKLDEADVIDLLRSSLASVVPSLWYENTPNSLLESLACGTPVIASDLGSMRDILHGTEAGLLFRVGDAASLADALREALAEPCADAMGERAQALARERHDPARHVDALLDLLEGVRSDRPRS